MTTAAEIDPAYRAARARLEERRNRYVTYTEQEELRAKLDGVELPRVGMYAPEFRAPATAAEAWDDVVVRLGGPLNRGWPEHRYLAAVAAAARDGGAAAAVKAVKDARQLEPAQQHAVYKNLLSLEKDPDKRFADVQQVVRAVLAEWERLDLAQGDEQAEAYRRRARKAGAA